MKVGSGVFGILVGSFVESGFSLLVVYDVTIPCFEDGITDDFGTVVGLFV